MDSPPILKTFEKTDCFLLCFSVASKPSFDNLEKVTSLVAILTISGLKSFKESSQLLLFTLSV